METQTNNCIRKIPKNDKRYEILKKIPKIYYHNFEDGYGLFVNLGRQPNTEIDTKFICIDYLVNNNKIYYCYRNILHYDDNRKNVKFYDNYEFKKT